CAGRERVASGSMNGQTVADASEVGEKIARLIEERGWNQEAFCRLAGLHRDTVRQILSRDRGRRLRIATVRACANALGLSVNELRSDSLERLLSKIRTSGISDDSDEVRRFYEEATQPELLA